MFVSSEYSTLCECQCFCHFINHQWLFTIFFTSYDVTVDISNDPWIRVFSGGSKFNVHSLLP
jgi:hypothetical protein